MREHYTHYASGRLDIFTSISHRLKREKISYIIEWFREVAVNVDDAII